MRTTISIINVTKFFSLHISGSFAPSHFSAAFGKFPEKNFKKFFPVTLHAAFQACECPAAGKNPGRQACGTGAYRPAPPACAGQKRTKKGSPKAAL
ncbi:MULTISPECIES: hypothetical protein [Desulfovibrio]|jgi:hypothetical protein|uniref:hypothetical protein n=1 Tax=Desulfovibrio TaxID=872 RepID=UPI0026F282B2|nr:MULTISPECIES: hypothetical protein [Desulfovibrio]MDY2666509.1 hypothetical protein [Desulfovibrio sp.]